MVRENRNGENPCVKGNAGKRKKDCSGGVGDGGRRRSFAACCATSKIAKLRWWSPKIGLGEFGPGPQEQSTELPGLAIWNLTTTHSLPWVCHHLLCSLHTWLTSVPGPSQHNRLLKQCDQQRGEMTSSSTFVFFFVYYQHAT